MDVFFLHLDLILVFLIDKEEEAVIIEMQELVTLSFSCRYLNSCSSTVPSEVKMVNSEWMAFTGFERTFKDTSVELSPPLMIVTSDGFLSL